MSGTEDKDRPRRESDGAWGKKYALRRPPELTPEIAASRWREVNRLLHSLVILHSELRERRTRGHVLRSARDLVSASRALLVVRDPVAGGYRVKAELGFSQGIREGIQGARAMATQALHSRKPILVASPAEEELLSEICLLGGGACLSVPILPRGVPWGVVQLLRETPFEEEEAILVWIYVMVLEEALADMPNRVRSAATKEIGEGERGLLDLPAFRGRFDQEIERSLWSGRPLSLLRLSWPLLRDDASEERVLFQRIVRVLRRSLRPQDLIAPLAPGELLVAVAGAHRSQAELVVKTLRRNLIQSRVLGEERQAVLGLRVAAATYPSDGGSAEELLEALAVPSAEEGDRARL